MDRKVLFFGIGMRDIQVVSSNESCSYREPIDTRSFEKYADLPWVRVGESQEKSQDERGCESGCRKIGIAYPMLEKTILKLKEQGVGEIDTLFLVATYREHIVPIIDRALKFTIAHGQGLTDELEKISRLARADYSSKTAHLIKDLFIEPITTILDFKINAVHVLDLGRYGWFDSLADCETDDSFIRDVTLKADINIQDFFEYELLHGLHRFFPELEYSTIYKSTHAGGMPAMLRGLDEVLNNVLLNHGTHRIFVSEIQGNQSESNSQTSLLNLFRLMNQNAVEMDWITVSDIFQMFIEHSPGYLSDDNTKNMRELLRKIECHQKSDNQWFSNFFVLIIRALYRQDYNNLIIWLKAMQEAAWIHILRINEDKHEYTVCLDDNNHPERDRERLDLAGGGWISINIKEVLRHIEEDKLDYCPDYIDLYHDRKNLTLNCKTDRIRKRRNQLIHNGIPLKTDKPLLTSLLDYLGIDYERMKEAVIHAKMQDWRALKQFESDILKSSKYFSTLLRISGNPQDSWLPFERTCLEDYMSFIHNYID